ncbi:hypothetical protein PABG_03669 [Paracoccidioides brasiliensis Pb03]|nr:hypothetical protein PABG_03669 [Paracoccidioides brasiliensis Pb03]
MASESFPLPESDLRRSATEAKRVHDHKAKWALGIRPNTHIWMTGTVKIPGTTRVRPNRPESHVGKGSVKINRIQMQSFVDEKAAEKMSHFRYIVGQFLNEEHHNSDSSADHDVLEPNEAADDPNVFYSFDARTGPIQGTDVLGDALTHALKKFEAQETEKLVREYEFVGVQEASPHRDDGFSADDGDFELINSADL